MKSKKRIKSITSMMAVVVAVVVSIQLVSAEQYTLLCLEDGEIFNAPNLCNPNMDPVAGPANLCVRIYDAGQQCPVLLNICNNLGLACGATGGGNIDSEPPEIALVSPVAEEVYDSRSVYIEISANEVVALYYRENPSDNWHQLCSSCTSYAGNRNFEEGLNEATFRAVDPAGNEAAFEVSFRIDSKDPRIRTIAPRDGFASGEFYVKFNEDNPTILAIHYGNAITGFRDYEIDLENECVATGGDRECTTNIDLIDYDEQGIEYSIMLEDISGNIDQSMTESLQVDYAPPVMTALNYEVNGKKVVFTIAVTETHFAQAEYYDSIDSNPRWKRLCSSLDGSGICEKEVSFSRDGNHAVDVRAVDEAGNSAMESIEFFTDSKEPRIGRSEPTTEFASGLFEVAFNEENPELVILEYGNAATGMRQYEIDVIEECDENNGRYNCAVVINLVDYNEQDFEYRFIVTDLAGQTDEDGMSNMRVDTADPVINLLDYQVGGRHVTFSIAISEVNFFEVLYKDNAVANSRWKRLCSKLEEGICEKKISLADGLHNIDIQVSDEAGNVVGTNVVFFTDSKEPRIVNLEPSENFASGEFTIEFKEENPSSLVLHYGNDQLGFFEREVALNSECLPRGNGRQECTVAVDLFNFDGSEIDWQVVLYDAVQQSAEGGKDDLIVDVTPPMIDAISYEREGNQANLVVNVMEEYFDEATYINRNDNNPRERRLCSHLESGVCKKRITLNNGINLIDIYVFDEAGNNAEGNVAIEV